MIDIAAETPPSQRNSGTSGKYNGMELRRGEEWTSAFVPKEVLSSHAPNSAIPIIQMNRSNVETAAPKSSTASQDPISHDPAATKLGFGAGLK
jgi:hypothetical protein